MVTGAANDGGGAPAPSDGLSLLRSAMGSASIGMCLAGPDGGLIAVNPSLCRLLGRDERSLTATTWQELTHPADLAADLGLAAEVLSGTRDSYRLRKRYLRPDDNVVHADLTVSCVRDDDGSVLHFVAQITDVTELVAARHELAEEREALRATIDSLLDAHVLLAAVRDAAGAIVDFTYEQANPAACSYLRVPREALLGARMLDLFPGQLTSGMFDRYVACVQTGEPLALHDIAITSEVAGETRWFDFSGARSGDWLSLNWRDVSFRVLDRQAIVQERARLQAVLDSGLEPQVYLRAERDGPEGAIVDFTYEQANPAACAYMRMDREEFEGSRLLALYPGRTGSGLMAVFAEAMATGEPLVLDDYALPTRDPSAARRFDVRAVRVGDGLSLSWRDVTDRFDAAQRLAASEERFRTAMASAPVGMALTHLDRTFEEVNQSLCAIVQRPSEWLLEHSVADLLDSEADRIDRELREQVLAGPSDHATAEHRLIRPGGEQIWVEHSVGVLRDADGTPSGFVSQFVDVTEARQTRERMRFMASHDPLTNLMNRRTFQDGVEELLSHRPRTGENIAVLFIDLDNLKPINDTFGHAAGDAVLAAVARRLRDAVRGHDLVARIGGDEFVVALTTIRNADGAAAVAAKIHDHVAVPVRADGRDIPVSISIGLALAQPGDDPDSALQRADDALYEAKQQGRGRTVIHRDAQSSG